MVRCLPIESVAGLCLYMAPCPPRLLFTSHHHPDDTNGLHLSQHQFFYLPGWKTQARNLQDTEPREQNIRRYKGRCAGTLRQTIHRPRGREGPGETTTWLTIGIADDQYQWEIKPLGPGYTIRKVVASFIIHTARPLNDFNRPDLPLPRDRTNSVLCWTG